jgi:V/A-type H+/Na+-transporting ATPase subunit D
VKMNINPTRMELQRLKKRITVARRGHKLLKDKQDELIKRFVDLVKENKRLREKVEEELTEAFGNFVLARAVMSREIIEESLIYPVDKVDIDIETGNIMSVKVPRIKIHQEESLSKEKSYPYGFVGTSGELDNAISILARILPDLLELAEIEKTCQLLSDEIEKTRRRVNALEHIMIPELEVNIKYITMKLNEAERATITRLMKVKEMVLEG